MTAICNGRMISHAGCDGHKVEVIFDSLEEMQDFRDELVALRSAASKGPARRWDDKLKRFAYPEETSAVPPPNTDDIDWDAMAERSLDQS